MVTGQSGFKNGRTKKCKQPITVEIFPGPFTHADSNVPSYSLEGVLRAELLGNMQLSHSISENMTGHLEERL